MAHKLSLEEAVALNSAFQSAGYSEKDIKTALEKGLIKQMWDIMYGHAAVDYAAHVIDCDVDPFVPNGCSIKSHRSDTPLLWNKVEQGALYRTTKQKRKAQRLDYVDYRDLKRDLNRRRVLNATVLDFLLAKPHLVPDEWKGNYVFFHGTIYLGQNGDPFVRCLNFTEGREKIDSRYRPLNHPCGFGFSHPAALRSKGG